MKRMGLIGLASAVGVALLVGSAQADLAKCQQGIEKNSDKLRAAIWKALAKCKDGYRAAIIKGEALNVKAGPSCQAGLFKVVDASNPVSSMAKTKLALDSLITKLTCSDQELFILGHLPQSVFGDHWSRWLEMAALKAAYEAQVSYVGGTANIFQELFATGTCAICRDLGRPPCQRASCPLAPGDGALPIANSEAETKALNGSLTVQVALSGELITEGCVWPGLTNGEIATVGGPSVSINPSTVLGTLTACTVTIRSEGFTNCSASGIQNTNVNACQDSRLDDPGANECPTFLGGTPLCLADPNSNTGGLCLRFTTSAGTPGSSIALTTSQIRIVNTDVMNDQRGPDGVACTADDTAPATPPNTLAITTGTARADTFDAGNTDGNQITEGPLTGAAGPGCAQLQAGNLTGLTLVSAFPGADTVGSALGDTVTETRLQCQ